MIATLKESLWTQFGASIDMVKNAIEMWPEERWHSNKKFFYMAYHVLVFLDYYLTFPAKTMSSSLPFTINETNPPAEALDDIIPNKIYGKQELLEYLHANREKCRQLIASLTEEKISDRWVNEWGKDYSLLEIILYNMRHVQHHVAQLNMMLRHEINDSPDWVSRARD